MTELYLGQTRLSSHQVGQVENGSVYSGRGWGRTCIGSYEDGRLYSGYGWGRTLIGMYEDGRIRLRLG